MRGRGEVAACMQQTPGCEREFSRLGIARSACWMTAIDLRVQAVPRRDLRAAAGRATSAAASVYNKVTLISEVN